MKNWFSVAARQDPDVLEVSIDDEIGFWGVTAADLLAEVNASKAGTVRLLINSPGGSVVDALAIFNGLRHTGKQIHVKVLGIAASAASYIAMAGDHVSMPENTFMFLHRPITGAYGNADDMRDTAEVLDKFTAALTAAYARRWKGTPEELDAVLVRESFLTAAECVEYGLADEMTAPIAVSAKFDTDRRDLPAHIQAVLARRVEPPAPAAPVAAPLAEQITSAANAAGVGAAARGILLHPTMSLDLVAAGAAIENARQVKALLNVFEAPEAEVDRSLASLESLDAARARLAARLVQEDEQAQVNSSPLPSNGAKAPGSFNVAKFWKDRNK